MNASHSSLNASPAGSGASTPSGTRKGNAPKCGCDGCTDRAVKIVGDCRYCNSKFCSRHRLPEAHACPNIQHCRDESSAKNAIRLLGDKCVAPKVQ
ncbi:uncharacterized protein BJ171DRAFT_491148 [Polychytrium aggregatum]|uniref:uncharacterized protein n=1 Tax=Polychytrium aggregatum TaxID=110093 RepID=UPI0022FDE621|nr:uncharacterized protein BJ171DRAFT_491148 [Polychytrium aggregatum]KAI9208380.1 hypothetical protein BJ171DRAFT_491148 [Polychytrium aggregatum]